MTLKEFMYSIFRLPAAIFNGIATLTFGGYALEKDGSYNKNKQIRGLLGIILDGAKYLLDLGKTVGRAISSFLKSHEQAIASAFWISLLIGGGAALMVAFWPAALVFVTNLSIAGYSIASLVGSGFTAQVAATAAIGTVLASTAVYTVAAVANFIDFAKNCCTRDTSSANEAPFVAQNLCDVDEECFTPSALSKLGGRSTVLKLDTAPVHSGGLIAEEAKEPSVEPFQEVESTLTINA